MLGGAANGTTQTSAQIRNEIIQTALQPTYANEVPNGLLWSPQLVARMAQTYDTLGQPLRPSDVLANIPKFVTNQVASNMTVGTSTANMTDVFAGDWTQ